MDQDTAIVIHLAATAIAMFVSIATARVALHGQSRWSWIGASLFKLFVLRGIPALIVLLLLGAALSPWITGGVVYANTMILVILLGLAACFVVLTGLLSPKVGRGSQATTED